MLPSAFPNVNPLIVKEQISASRGPVLDPVFTDCRHQVLKPLPGAKHIAAAPVHMPHYGANCVRKASASKRAVDCVKMPLLYDVSPPFVIGSEINYDSTHL